MAREVLVKPLGLVTRPNIYGQYPVGGLSVAQNLVMRAPGILECAPATVAGVSFGAANDVVHQLLSLPSTVMFSWVRTGAGVWTIYGTTTASTYVPTAPVPTFSTTGRITPAVLRDRIIVNSDTVGHYVCDPQDQTPPAAFRRAGFAVPFLFRNASPTTNAQALPPSTAVGYAAIYKRVYSDGYTLVSRPSAIVTVVNIAVVTVDIQLNVRLNISVSDRGVRAGDLVEIYRTDIVTQAVNATDPGTTLKKIITVTLTAADIAAGFILTTDSTLPGPLNVTEGEALYTNPGQQGLLGANRYPESSKCIATFKGYAFYGNITQRPQLIFSSIGGISGTGFTGWNTAVFRKTGLGERLIFGTITLGSPTITGISATDMLGVAVGQYCKNTGTPFPLATKVLSFNVGAGTITMTANAIAGAASVFITDIITINGQDIIVGNTNQATLSALLGTLTPAYEVTTSENVYEDPPTSGLQKLITYIVEPLRIDTTVPITVSATNGTNYVPQLPSIPAAALSIPYKTYKNLLAWSKDSQPEHVPVPNNTFVGTGEIIAFESTRDALWIFCTDGLFRLSGDGGQWRVDTVDTTCILASPRASCVLREAVYAYTNQGFVRVTDAGVEQLSERILGDLLPGAEYTETASIILERNEAEDEIVIRLDATRAYIYSTRENAYTTALFTDVTAMAYVRYPVSGAPALALGRSPAGSAPSYELWNSTAAWLIGTARFQPVFAGDPFSAKRWIDAVFIFDQATQSSSLQAFFNTGASVFLVAKNAGRYFNESRVNVGVPRTIATANSIAISYITVNTTAANKLYAISFRYRQFGEQQLKRT